MTPRGPAPGTPKTEEHKQAIAAAMNAKAEIRAATRRSAAVTLKEVGTLLGYEQDPKLLAEIVEDLVGVVSKLIEVDEANSR